MNVSGFTPCNNKSISCTVASGSVTLDAVGIASTELLLTNIGANPVFVRWGVGAQNAVTTDFMLPAAMTYPGMVSKGLADTVAAINGSGTSTLYISAGNGRA